MTEDVAIGANGEGVSALSGGGRNASLQGPCGGADTRLHRLGAGERPSGTTADTGNGEGPGWTGAGD